MKEARELVEKLLEAYAFLHARYMAGYVTLEEEPIVQEVKAFLGRRREILTYEGWKKVREQKQIGNPEWTKKTA